MLNETRLLLTIWKLRKFSLILFSQKFRENNGFTKEVTKNKEELISRNIFWMRIILFIFIHCGSDAFENYIDNRYMWKCSANLRINKLDEMS